MKSRWPLALALFCLGGLFAACNLGNFPKPYAGTSLANAPSIPSQTQSPPVLYSTSLNIAPVVNTTADHDDGSCDASDCTLREAIRQANASTGAVIRFNIPGAGVHTIRPAALLPDIQNAVTIDGTSQPGFSGSPLIELDGSLAGNASGHSHGLNVAAGGGHTTLQGLAINRFPDCGINIAAEGVEIYANYLGTDPSGTANLGNHSGICIQAGNDTIGGTTSAQRNLISGNYIGINFWEPAANSVNTIIQGNYIGTDASGTAALGNASYGIQVYGAMDSGLQIGGSAAGTANVISGNGGDGIMIDVSDSANKFIVQNNMIGTAANGQGALGNGGNGLWIFGGKNIDIEENRIAYNAADGVFVQTGKDAAQTPVDSNHDTIRRNSIHDNGKLGIAIDEDGVIPNDPLDADAGANSRQNFPDLASAVWNGSQLEIKGALSSAAGAVDTVDFYLNSACDPSGYGEGQNPIGTMTAASNINGLMMIQQKFSLLDSTFGMFLTAIATDADGNTSEFSRCIPVTSPAPTPTPAPTQTKTPTLFLAKKIYINTPTLHVIKVFVPSNTPTLTLIPPPK